MGRCQDRRIIDNARCRKIIVHLCEKNTNPFVFLFKNTVVFYKKYILTEGHMFFGKYFMVYAELDFFSSEGFTLDFLCVSMRKNNKQERGWQI